MLEYKVEIKDGKASYTEIATQYDQMARKTGEETRECTAEEMYSNIWAHIQKQYFMWQGVSSLIIGGFAGAYIGVILAAPFLVAFGYFIFKSISADKCNIEYTLDQKAKERVNLIQNAYAGLNTAQSVFPAAGEMTIKKTTTNESLFGWVDPTDNDEIWMLPDVCLVNVKQTGFVPIEYNKMYIGFKESEYKEMYPASDSKTLGTTYLHTRKNGQPDLRYKDNPTIYRVVKGFVLISDDPSYNDAKADSNFSAGIIISSPSIAKKFYGDLQKVFGSAPTTSSPKPKPKSSDTGSVDLDSFDTNTGSGDSNDFITLPESMFVLAFSMGYADGDFSDQEIEDLCRDNSVYRKYAEQIDNDAFKKKIKTGKCTKELAVSVVKKQSPEVQLDAMAIVWHVLVSDGVMTDDEKTLMAELLAEFDLTIDEVNDRYKQIVG